MGIGSVVASWDGLVVGDGGARSSAGKMWVVVAGSRRSFRGKGHSGVTGHRGLADGGAVARAR
ncbi:hypothetical protein, partial [Nonomuraea lactucae]|uniref:hypothetical protein n=1 Tax=Nonomuraea lactucae TaxID=2249762 RepID=UPI001963DFBF